MDTRQSYASTRGGHAATVTTPSEREILITRDFDAPRRLVFEAWTTPEHVRRWYGCGTMPMSVCEIDLRPDGAWRYGLLEADGTEHRFRGTYREVVPHERLVYTESYDLPGMGWTPESIVTLTLEEIDGKTRMTSRVLHQSVEMRDGHLGAGMESGMQESLDRLADLLAEIA